MTNDFISAILFVKGTIMKHITIIALLLLSAGIAQAEDNKNFTNRINISSSFKKEVDQDQINIRLNHTVTKMTAAEAQKELTLKINKALEIAKSRSDNFKNYTVKSGQVSVSPLYKYTNGKQIIENWRGYGEIIIEGKNITEATTVASELPDVYINSINLSVSAEKIQKHKDEVIKEAINTYKSDAKKITENFGYKSYAIKEIQVTYNPQDVIMPRAHSIMGMSNELSAKTSAPISVEPGKSVIEASVSGTIEMTQ